MGKSTRRTVVESSKPSTQMTQEWNSQEASIVATRRLRLSGKSPYRIDGPRFGFSRRHAGKNGVIQIQLSNFIAIIRTDVTEDDGIESRHVFDMVSYLRPDELNPEPHEFKVTAEEFEKMLWPATKIGAQAIVMPGQREHLRAAIQFQSGAVPRCHVYSHTGWRKIDQEWCYLHGDGAIGVGGAKPVGVRLPPGLQAFRLPPPPAREDLRTSILASLRILKAAPLRVTVPLFSAIWRSVLGDTDFGMHLVGPTGSFKTALAALAQQHFGAGFDAAHLPASWSSTANANSALQFALKDSILLIDDFVGQGSDTDVVRAHRDAERIFRGQGNQAGRARLARDGMTLREAKPPRCLTLSTGETVPSGQSVQARVWIIEIEPYDIDVDVLTACQRDAEAGLYAQTMSGFLAWIAPDYSEWRNWLRDYAMSLRSDVSGSNGQHRRSPGQVANLQAAFELFLHFARTTNVISPAKFLDLARASWQVLTEEAARAARDQAEQEPCGNFLDLLRAVITSGTHVLGSAESGEALESSQNKGRPLIGWRSGNGLVLLEPETAYAAAQRLANDQKRNLALTSRILYKRMEQRGLIAHHDEGRTTVRHQIGNVRRRVICVRSSDLLGEDLERDD